MTHERFSSTRPLRRRRLTPFAGYVALVVDLLFYLVYTGLGLRFVLILLHARPDAGFVRWVNTVTDPLYAPFRDILPTVNVGDDITISLSVAFAFVMYAVLHALVLTLLRVFGKPTELPD